MEQVDVDQVETSVEYTHAGKMWQHAQVRNKTENNLKAAKSDIR